MKTSYIFLVFISIAIVISGCSYSLRMNAFPHLNNIMVNSFRNETDEIEIEDRLRETLTRKFTSDGRLRIVSIDSDSYIEGRIIDYADRIHGYDMENNIDEYRVSIMFDVMFYDNVLNQVIWNNSSLILNESYFPNSNEPLKIKTRKEAEEEIFKNLFEILIRNSLESW